MSRIERRKNILVYMGSKNRLAKDIVPIIQKYIDENNIKTYIELFGGGCNVADKIKCDKRIVCDISQPLISLLKYVRDNPNLEIAPKECSFEHFKEVRDAQGTGKYSDEYTAIVGYCASYCGGYFPRGYARGNDSNGNPRDMYNERINNLKKQAPSLQGIDFYCGDYLKFKHNKFENALYYLDPPYANTKQYANQKIDYDEFYDFCRELSKNNIVLISEYDMPNDFECIWAKERKVMLDSARHEGIKAVEKLFKCQELKTNEIISKISISKT